MDNLKKVDTQFVPYGLFYLPLETALIIIMEKYDLIKSEIGINEMCLGTSMRNLVEQIILEALLLPYELSADYKRNCLEHINRMIKELSKLTKTIN